jgi:transposase
MLPTVTLPDAESRRITKVVKVRDKIVKRMTELKNQIHALFMEEGLEVKKSLLTSVKRLEGLKEADMEEHAKMLVGLLIDELLRLKETKAGLERKLEEMTKQDQAVELLRTIPGTGLVSACAVRGIVADIRRFDDPKKLAAYAGLVPWVSNSNQTVRHGHITKHGSALLRMAFVQMAMGMIRGWAGQEAATKRLDKWYRKLATRAGGSKGKIALALRMSRIVWAMLQTGTPFSYSLT